MINAHDRDGVPVPGRFIRYDSLNPSPLFTKPQIKFIEKPYEDFTEEDLRFIKNFEWFILNLETFDMNFGVIPGLRDSKEKNCVYIRRFNMDKYKSMIWKFLDYIPFNYPREDVYNLNRPAIRVVLGDGDRYYPIEYRGDLDQWQRRLRESAEIHNTLVGRFERGKFIVSDGQKIDFSALKVERCGATVYPDDW